MRSELGKRKILLRGLAVLIVLAVLSGCKRSNPAPTGEPAGETPTSDVVSGKVTITMQDGGFHPERVTVKVGTTVSWINRDPSFYSIRSDTDIFKSTLIAVGQVFSYLFDDPGTYPYYCEQKGGPGGKGMSGVIVVVS
jgi:plastocyanin